MFACKLKVEDLLDGEYVPPSEEEPAHLITPWGQKVFRGRVMGTVVEKWIRDDQSYGIIYLDDGSGVISVRNWREGVPKLAEFEVGALVDVIGRIRQYSGEIYLVPDLIVRVEDPNWELVRELEILIARREALRGGVKPKKKALEMREIKIEAPGPREEGVEEEIEVGVEDLLPEVPEEMKKKALLVFEKLDREEGIGQEELEMELKVSGSEAEDILTVLLAEGEIFEVMTGRYRKVK